MKRLLLIAFIGVFITTLTVKSQTTKDSYKYVFLDTLKKSGDSIKIFTVPIVITGQYDYTVQLIADSVAGATAATAYLQLSISSPPGISYTNIPSKTLAIDGLKSETILTGTVTNGKLRIRWVKGTGWTQQTKIRASVVLSKSTITSSLSNLWIKSDTTSTLQSQAKTLNQLHNKWSKSDTTSTLETQAKATNQLAGKWSKSDTTSTLQSQAKTTNQLALKPTIVTGADTTGSTPSKAGNIFIKSNGDIFISKSAVRGGWVKLN